MLLSIVRSSARLVRATVPCVICAALASIHACRAVFSLLTLVVVKPGSVSSASLFRMDV